MDLKGSQMIGYVPILKSKPAEIWAWANASPRVLSASRVVFEVVPTDTKTSPVINFVNRLIRHYPVGQVITVDCGLFGQSSSVVTEISRALIQNGVNERPVFRLSDTPAILSQIRQACALHGQGACLRLGNDYEDPDPNVATQDVLNAVGSIGLNTSQIDLIIDFKEVASARDMNRCVPVALRMLVWASKCGNWRSITLASGAFIKTVSGLALGRASQLERFDAILFARVAQRNPVIIPDFGHYGINYPIFGPTPPRAPNPNLRYTDGLQWQIDREPRNLPGNNSFYTICQRLLQAPYWKGANYSAGDREFQQYAQGIGGPGSATNWLSFGESHHFAHIVDRLATLGVP